MEKKIITLECKNCGEKFLSEYNGNGSTAIYCDTCRILKIKENKKRYKDKIRKKANELKEQGVDLSYKNLKKMKGERKLNKDVLVLNCKNCREDFLYEYRGSGRKPEYCEDCRKKIDTIHKKLYRESKKEEDVVDNNIKEITQEIKNTGNMILNKHNAPKKIDNIDEKYNIFVNEISRLLMQLDTTRVELCNISKQLYEYQSEYDKTDQTFLHQLEQLDTIDMGTATKFVTDWKISRKNRRNMKDLIAVVSNAIDSIPYKNFTNALPVLKGSAYYKNNIGTKGE